MYARLCVCVCVCGMGSSGKGLSLVLDDCRCPDKCSINNRES